MKINLMASAIKTTFITFTVANQTDNQSEQTKDIQWEHKRSKVGVIKAKHLRQSLPKMLLKQVYVHLATDFMKVYRIVSM